MNIITSTFWGEGPSDERFLPKLIERALEAILVSCARGEWEVHEPLIIRSEKDRFADQMVDVAVKSSGSNLVFIHTDADGPHENHRAVPFKIIPALKQLSQLSDGEACKNIVAVIPVTKIENWKLADMEALQEVLGIELDLVKLGLNIGVQQLEQRANSKELLLRAMNEATALRGKRRHQFSLEDIDAVLAKRISLQRIAHFDSFQRFLGRLRTALIQQNIIREDCDELLI